MNGDMDLSRAVGRIEGKLDAIHREVTGLRREQVVVADRVDRLEAKNDKQKGAFAVVGGLAGVIGAGLTILLRALGFLG